MAIDRILDVGGAGDCFFRVMYHQLYGEPSYHMNVHSTGVADALVIQEWSE